MGALRSFIEKEFLGLSDPSESEIQDPGPAKVANLAKVEPEISNFSNFSSQPNLKVTFETLQAEADRRNVKAKRQQSTDRYCRCGRLAELAWPLEGRNEMWRCFGCLEPRGRA